MGWKSLAVLVLIGLTAHTTLSHVVYMHQRVNSVCDVYDSNARFDCHPGPDANEQSCQANGCCWQAAKSNKDLKDINVPYCYFPSDYVGYSLTSINRTKSGYTAQLSRQTKSGWPEDVMNLQLDIYFYETYLRFKV